MSRNAPPHIILVEESTLPLIFELPLIIIVTVKRSERSFLHKILELGECMGGRGNTINGAYKN